MRQLSLSQEMQKRYKVNISAIQARIQKGMLMNEKTVVTNFSSFCI